jgi:hypothetical protein
MEIPDQPDSDGARPGGVITGNYSAIFGHGTTRNNTEKNRGCPLEL